MFKKILLVLVVLIGVTIGYYYSDISKALNTATGFTAKNLCSGHYNSGYRLERFMREALIPVNPVFEYVSFEHDEKRKLIRTSIFGMKSRTAQYRDGLGCTLLGVDQEFLTGNTIHREENIQAQIGRKDKWQNNQKDQKQKVGR